MSGVVTSAQSFESTLRETRRWSAKCGIPVVEATLNTDGKSLLHIHWDEPERRLTEFLTAAERFGAPYMVIEQDFLFEEDVEEALASAVSANAAPATFAELWNCREKAGQLCFLRLSFVEPKTNGLFHLELQAPFYDLVFNTEEHLSEDHGGDDPETTNKA